MSSSRTPERQLKWWQISLAVVGVLLVFASPLPFILGQPNAASEYGALLQGIAGTVALGLLLVALHLQRRDLELTRDEMKENNRTQADQRDQMTLQLAEMKRQNDLLIEQHDLRLKPILEPHSSASQHFNLDLQNHGFERGYVWRVRVRKTGDGTSGTADIAGLVNSLVDRSGVRSLLSSAVSANDTTPRLLRVGEGYPVLDFSMDFSKAKSEDLLRALRLFYEALAEYEVVADTTDLRNRQPEEFRFDLRRFVAQIGLPEKR